MKRITAFILILVTVIFLFSCSRQEKDTELKYIFMFIGDGMSFNAVQLARDTVASRSGESVPAELSFTDFDTVGLFTNYDADSFIPDSASSGTAMATGIKTHSGNIARATSGKDVDSIATVLKQELGMKVGIITTANLNHATPSVFYAHSSSRYDFYNIGKQLAKSNFDFFAGGELLSADDGEENLVDIAEKNGYKVSDTKEEILNIKSTDKNLIISPDCDSSGMIGFNIDRDKEALSLSDYLTLAIDTLDNDNGFFIMCEGGRIDSALHANDAATAVGEVEELSDAVQTALDFYKKHPEETLIIVTGDHETGGLSLGYTATEYSTHFEKLSKQKLSYLAYDNEYVNKYISQNTPLDVIISDLKDLFGLEGITEYERERLSEAWDKTLSGTHGTYEELILYYNRTPLTAEVTRIVANRSGIGFSSFVHTASLMPLWAKGAYEDEFAGTYDNTDVYNKLYSIFFK